MNNLIRFFALSVAIAGLACSTLAPANPKIRDSRNSIALPHPGLQITLPGPVTCQELNLCIVPNASTR